MITKDEEIQRLLDSHKAVEPSPDAEIYQAIYRELNQVPQFSLNGLANGVILHIQRRKESRALFISILIAFACVFLAAVVFVIVTGAIGDSLLDESIRLLSDQWITLVYLAVIVLGIKFLDWKISDQAIANTSFS